SSGYLSSSFTSEQMVKLLSLIKEKHSPAANMLDMFNVVDISSLMLTVGYPNGTLAKISAIYSLRLTSGIVLFDIFVIPEYNTLVRPYDEEEDTSNMEGNTWVTSDDCDNTVEVEVTSVASQIEDNVTSEVNVYVNQNGEGPSNVLGTSPVLRRSTKQRVLPSKFNDFVVNSNVRYGLEKYVCYANLSNNFEMEALYRNNTYVLADLPPRRKAVGCKWIWKIKYKSYGEIDRCLIALFVQNGWPLFQLDVNNAILYDDLNEEIYMELPHGYYDKNETKFCKLVKSLYGLKHAPRQWNGNLTTALIENSFVQSKNDYSLYVKSKNGIFIAISVYVDDIMVTGNNKNEIDKKYCLELLSEYGLLACKPAATPLQQNVHMHAPLESHYTAALRVLRYLKNAPGIGVHFYKGKGLSLHAYSDADWAKLRSKQPFLGLQQSLSIDV
ncbi:ribonuclease H-like domain-containing protein, partial [Tanacetum coccineum]